MVPISTTLHPESMSLRLAPGWYGESVSATTITIQEVCHDQEAALPDRRDRIAR
jgi:hypothetical protein